MPDPLGMRRSVWYSEIDRLSQEVRGKSVSDISDELLWDYWVSGYSPQDALEELINLEED